MSQWYRLEGKTPVPMGVIGDGNETEAQLRLWAEWFERGDQRRVAITQIRAGMLWPTRISVSTVFLGLDHSFKDDGSQLFESMRFSGQSWLEDDMVRYATWDDAVAGHHAMVARAIKSIPLWRRLFVWKSTKVRNPEEPV